MITKNLTASPNKQITDFLLMYKLAGYNFHIPFCSTYDSGYLVQITFYGSTGLSGFDISLHKTENKIAVSCGSEFIDTDEACLCEVIDQIVRKRLNDEIPA